MSCLVRVNIMLSQKFYPLWVEFYSLVTNLTRTNRDQNLECPTGLTGLTRFLLRLRTSLSNANFFPMETKYYSCPEDDSILGLSTGKAQNPKHPVNPV